MSDYSVAQWIAPSGDVWYLDDPVRGIVSAAGVVGLGPIARKFATDDRTSGGVSVRHIQAQPRSITWALHVWGDSHQEYIDRYHALVSAFASTDESGPGTLVIQRPDGSMRQIKAYFDSGLDPAAPQGWRDATVPVTLFCPDGYFTDVDPTVIKRSFSTARNFLSPYLAVTSAQTLGTSVVHNPGDADAYPMWTVTGPVTQLVADQLDSGESFTFDTTVMQAGGLTAGQQATITTEPVAARGPSGANWSRAINWPAGIVWALPKGDTNVQFTLNGSGAGASVSLSFLARYKSA